ncbi:hypothetical protein HOV12_gp46 [Streptomyces phage Lilbooboo]|uniref:Uncharacterized protein n=1 Tax=Streptomyces phage Lilbooboo TaxID=2510571 RepID=A0A411B329_9CAUD|nr:hypothetical protein HOV12_gp46 [Streptomyces phage Lilbooboo]QAX94746.1 hypothetical protein SEA_LILBOOBOO_47 [Streptomyces phage Lilbooboo]
MIQAQADDDEGADDMPEIRELKCVAHGEKCNGNPKHAHIFRWVKR